MRWWLCPKGNEWAGLWSEGIKMKFENVINEFDNVIREELRLSGYVMM